MQIYLPVAEISLSLFTLLILGGGVGIISGLLGVGGGFLLTPLLIFLGIPTATTVSTVASIVTASSVSGALNYWKRKTIDFEMASILILGGLIGSYLGVELFVMLKRLGFLSITVLVGYVVFLGSTGFLMFIDSIYDIFKIQRAKRNHFSEKSMSILSQLPLQRQFETAKVRTSLLGLVFIGMVIGFIGSILGLGGGFILIPMMIYLFRIPGPVVLGTAQIYIFATMLSSTILHAWASTSLDIVLALILILGGIIGSHIGLRAQKKMSFQHLRLVLGILLIGVAIHFASTAIIEPEDKFTLILEAVK